MPSVSSQWLFCFFMQDMLLTPLTLRLSSGSLVFLFGFFVQDMLLTPLTVFL